MRQLQAEIEHALLPHPRSSLVVVERMNNLLRTLTESQVQTAHPNSNLRLLLTAVKETRRQSYDSKLADAFYDSLEGLLLDLRTISIDNHDAEAFLKPVQKSEVPDYYDVISNPMDLQTMLKKVKQKVYKSKREFKDDLDLIWSNCYTYNAAENHPLRQCAKRLRVKAERLLKSITDRKERTDPTIPSDLPTGSYQARPKINGYGQTNGHAPYRSPSFQGGSKVGTPLKMSPSPYKKVAMKDLSFPETPAIIRTPSGMATFLRLDSELDGGTPSSSQFPSDIGTLDLLQEYATYLSYDDDQHDAYGSDDTPMDVDDAVGDKRKLNGAVDNRPRKRTRFSTPPPDTEDVTHLWWKANQAEELLGNGLPPIVYSSSKLLSKSHSGKHRSSVSKSPTTPRRRKKSEPASPPPPKSLLTVMNNNIRTIRRVRRTHTKFAALNLNNTSTNIDEDGAGNETGFTSGPGILLPPAIGEEDTGGLDDDQVDDRPWLARWKGKRRLRGGIDIGEKNATDCIRWAGEKILEHAGFQGTSKEALDVLTGVTSEYLLNVGRTIRFLCDRFAHSMTPEEIILHTLFESGTAKIQDLEKYISDDVERYGGRLGELEKKLIGAYRETTAVDVPEDEGLFEEDEEDGGALVLGNFADAFGEDFLGLRELGIAAEYGLSSLTIPKRLLKGRKEESKLSASSAKPKEPPPPYPPPAPFIPLDSTKVDDQIGLLKPYYQSRVFALSTASTVPVTPGVFPPSGRTSFGPSGIATPVEMQLLIITLPDDPPNPSQIKVGPLGQIIKSAPPGASSKKKAKPVAPAPAPAAGGNIKLEGSGDIPPGDAPSLPKKKKGPTGVGTGNGRKKKVGVDGQALEDLL